MNDTGRGLKSGVKPTSGASLTATVQAGSVLSGITGVIWALFAAMFAFGYMIVPSDSGSARIAAVLLALASAGLGFPPLVSALRRGIALLRPTAVPPLLAAAMLVGSAFTAIPHMPLPPDDDLAAGPASRLSTQDALAEARAALTAGDHERALTSLTALPEREQTGHAEVVALMKDAMRHRQALGFAAQVNTYVLPDIAGLTAPAQGDDVSAVWNIVTKFEDLAREFEDAKALPLNDEGKAALAQARAALSAKQAALFPALRRAWREKAAHTFWLMDVDLAVSGARADTVTWTGARFAANANIQQSQQGVVQNLSKLRFRQSRYRWFSRADQITQYPMTSPADGQIGYWNGGAFVAVG